MGVFKNGVGRPSNETIKKRNIFKGICVLLVLIIIGMTVYILNDKGIIKFNNKINDNSNKTTTVTTKKEIQEDISIEEAKKIYNEVFGVDFDKHVFDTDNLLYMNSEEYKTATALVSAINKNKQSDKYDAFKLIKDKLQKEGEGYSYNYNGWSDSYDKEKTYVYTYEDINSELKNLYGSDDKLFENSFNYYQYLVIFVPKEKVYVVLETVFGDGGHTVLKSMINAKKYENQVSINVLVQDVWLGEEECEFSFTSNTKDSKICLSKEDINDEDNILQKYKDDVFEYKYIFAKKNDGTYYFDRIEKVK